MVDGVNEGFTLSYKDSVSRKEMVGFVEGKLERIGVVREDNHSLATDLSPILNFFVVRESHFSQAHKGEEACGEHCKEKEVVMRLCCVLEVGDNCRKV